MDYLTNKKQISINHMIAEYLKNNIDKISNIEVSNINIISNPNIDNQTENKERWILFSEKFWLFIRFLPHCDWYIAEIDLPNGFDYINLINHESWYKTFPTKNRLVKDLYFTEQKFLSHNDKVDKFYQNGILNFINNNKLILIGKYQESKLSIIDGNHRFCSLFQTFQEGKIETYKIKVIVGYTFGNCRWVGDKIKWVERPSDNKIKRYILNTW